MTLSIGQTTWNLFPDNAEPGQLADCAYNEVVSFVAAEAINPGRLCAIASDGLSVQQLQLSSSSTITGAVGVSLLRSARESSGSYGVTAYGIGGLAYQVGETVPVLLRGRVYAEWKGTTQPAFGTPNVYASSTTVTDRGKFTDAAPSAGAGTEVGTGLSGIKSRQAEAGTSSYILIDVNLPGAA
jgi:hypothetical protein